MNTDHYTWRVTWAAEDRQHVGLCAEFPSLSWLAASPQAAFEGIHQLVADAVADMRSNGEAVPAPFSERDFSGELEVRVPPRLHRALAMQAAEQGVSLERLVNAKLATGT